MTELPMGDGLFSTFCLNPKWSLRRQLLTSFGTTAVVSIGAVMIIATLTTNRSGESVKTEARQSLKEQIEMNLEATARYTAETLSKKLFDGLGGAAAIMEEAAADRIVGYPNNFEKDDLVPFTDSITQRSMYPLDMPALVLEWNISSDLNRFNARYHLGPERVEFYGDDLSQVTTANGDYFMQGICDPSVANPDEMTYFEGCTDANNDVTTGGVVHPTLTNKGLHDKSADLVPILKALYESHTDVKALGLYYANSGAGSVVSFPGNRMNASHGYISIGCEWMDSANPLDPQRTIASRREIERCQAQSKKVFRRRYNPLERGWCMDQALNPGKTRFHGPYLDASSEKLWLMTIGRAVYDRVSKNFIGCTLLDVAISQIEDILAGVKIGNTSEIVLVNWEDGTVVASPEWDTVTSRDTVQLWDLDLGIDKSLFHDIRSPIAFEGSWTPIQVKEAYKNVVWRHDGRLMATYPVPVPASYDESFRPEYLIVLTIQEEEVYSAVVEMVAAIDQDSEDIIKQTLTIGFAGMALVLIIVVFVSLLLTKPLSWMADVADQIVENAGNENLEQGLEADRNEAFFSCTPRTEVTNLVDEFQTMIYGLGGSGAAKVARREGMRDILNTIQWREGDVFKGRYRARAFRPVPGENRPISAYGMDKTNRGKNVFSSPSLPCADTHSNNRRARRLFASPLFWHITIAIVSPLLLTMVAICVIVSLDVTEALPSWLEDVKDASVILERYAITTASIARAHFSTEVIHEVARDNFLLMRIAGWLLFGALPRGDAFTTLGSATEECKHNPYGRRCDFFRDPERALCDCEWDDVYNLTCSDVEWKRHKQLMFFAGQARDADPVTGDRFKTSFVPGVSNVYDSSPGTTLWYDNQASLPGSFKGPNASGYETTYDRVRVLSALSVILFPIFNHKRERGNDNYYGAFIGLEQDGMMVGYEGCDYSMAEYAGFQSTRMNRASEIRNGTLCPLDKFGYDCRCREWYDEGKQKGLSIERIPVHVTAPYVFSGGEHIATTITSPLVDPRDNTHVGQTIIDFVPSAIINALEDGTTIGQSESGFATLITPERDSNGGDTVVGPGYKLSDESSPPIESLILPFDEPQSDNLNVFKQKVLEPMQKGGSPGSSTFSRKGSEDGNEETVFLAWAPVLVDTPLPRNPASFSDGATPRQTVVYSVGIAIPEQHLLLPFVKIEDDISSEINRYTVILVVLIVAAAAIAAVTAGSVAVSVSGTVTGLLDIVNRINMGKYGDSLPAVMNGSREARMVYAAFKKLFTVVRFSNHSFFSGDLENSYTILYETYELFCNLNNKKATGIASNNLGNILLQIGRDMIVRAPEAQFDSLKHNNLSLKEQARQHFDEAVENGELDYYSASEEMKSSFAQQQSNRHFNRGLFLLETRSVNDPGSELLQGYQDIERARDYDNIACTTDAVERFETVLRRAEGLSTLLAAGVEKIEDFWDLDELLDEAKLILQQEFDSTESVMFKELSQTGRLQQLECQEIEVHLARGQFSEALEIALRIVVEDEYILSTVLPTVAKCLSAYLATEVDDPALAKYINNSLSSMSDEAGGVEGEQHLKCVFFCLDYSRSMNSTCASTSTGTLSTRILTANKNLLKIFDDHVSDNDYCGFLRFNHLVDTWFHLTRKGDDRQRLRDLLSGATNAEGGTRMYRAISLAVDEIVSSSNSSHCEAWIIALTDGCSADEPDAVMSRLRASNSSRAFKINVIVVGVEVPNRVVQQCRNFCTVTDKSRYIDARGGLDAIDEAFEQVANIISSRGTTMETFPVS